MISPDAISLESRPALTAGVRLHTDPVNGEPVLLYPEGFLQLSATAADIVRHCHGRISVAEMLRELGTEYDAPAEALQQDVLECLADLARRTLLEFRA